MLNLNESYELVLKNQPEDDVFKYSKMVGDLGDLYIFEKVYKKISFLNSLFNIVPHPGFSVVNKETGEVLSWSHVEYLIEKGERVGNKEIEWISL